MIVVQLQGGLGNQMFEYAAGRALAERTGGELYLDAGGLEEDPLRGYALGGFRLESHFAAPEEVRRLAEFRNTVFRKILWKLHLSRRTENPAVLRERVTQGLDERIFRAGRDTYLQGYWQNEGYFEDFEKVIRQCFAFRQEPQGKNAVLARRIRDSENPVAVHIRRGDYLLPKNMGYHGLCDLDYYGRAMQRMESRLEGVEYFVFSDDPAWAESNLQSSAPLTVVNHNDPEQGAHEDLRLMSLCRHHIIANSSFSWWGAWLGEKPGQRVIAPQRWFADPERPNDIVPERWERI